MFTECPLCGKSDKVTSLNGFRSAVAAVCEVATVLILGKNGQGGAKIFLRKSVLGANIIAQDANVSSK